MPRACVRCSPSVISCRRDMRRRRAICWRRSIGGRTSLRTSSASRVNSRNWPTLAIRLKRITVHVTAAIAESIAANITAETALLQIAAMMLASLPLMAEAGVEVVTTWRCGGRFLRDMRIGSRGGARLDRRASYWHRGTAR
jgi:hypothetical protein